MADLQNTTPATPSVSVESVPARFVPVPVVASEAMEAAVMAEGIPCYPKHLGAVYRTMIAAAPAPNPSPAAKSGEAGVERLVDELACWMHGEVNWPDQHSGRSWPEHDEDTGARGNNAYVTLVHMDAVHQWRDIARRMVKGFRLEQGPLALATPSPQPADAVREAGPLVIKKLNEMRNMAARPGELDKHMLMNRHWLNSAINVIRAALTEPAPTGEAVEPVASYQKNAVGSDTLFWLSRAVRDEMPNNGSLFAHPAPEDAARLREDLKELARSRNEAWHELALSGKARREAERDRDDAREALETANEDIAYFEEEARRFASNYTPNSDGWNTFIIFADKIADRAAARSASREATR